MSSSNKGFLCKTCGKWHEELPMDVGCEFPDHYFGVPESERASRVWCDRAENPNFCVIDKRDRFIRGCLIIPVTDGPDEFVFGLWTTLSEKNFNRAISLWDSPVPENEPAYFGWLSNRLEGFPDSLNLKAKLRLRNGNLRPSIELEPTDNPLSVAQRNGFTMERVLQIVEPLMH